MAVPITGSDISQNLPDLENGWRYDGCTSSWIDNHYQKPVQRRHIRQPESSSNMLLRSTMAETKTKAIMISLSLAPVRQSANPSANRSRYEASQETTSSSCPHSPPPRLRSIYRKLQFPNNSPYQHSPPPLLAGPDVRTPDSTESID